LRLKILVTILILYGTRGNPIKAKTVNQQKTGAGDKRK